jgi:uncharacterized membrane protein
MNLLALFLLSIPLTMSKHAYFPLLLCFFLIPASFFRSGKKGYLAAFGLLFFINLSLNLWWSSKIGYLVVPSNQDFGVSPERQLSYIMGHPLTYAETFLRTIVMQFQRSWFTVVGKMGWLDTNMPAGFQVSYVWALAALALFGNPGPVDLRIFRKKAIIFTAIFSCVVLFSTSEYLIWTPVGNPYIDGLQPRYVIPLLPLFFILFGSRILGNLFGQRHLLELLMGAYLLFSLIFALIVITIRYYVTID